MEIRLFSFQGIRNGISYGVVKGFLPIIDKLDEKLNNRLIYYLGSNNGYEGSIHLIGLNNGYVFLIRLISLVNRMFFKLPSYKLRYINERLFDVFAARKINNPCIIISTAYLSKTLLKNKALGGTNIFFAGNPDDFDINIILKKEQKVNNVVFKDAYTYEKRLKFISKSIFLFDHIITLTISQFESYRKRVNKEKVSFVEYHIIPNSKAFPFLVLPKGKELSFCFVAHPFWLKGLPNLLDAWSKINQQGIKLRIAGTINQYLQKVIDEKFSSLENVEYLGWVEDLNMFYRTSSVCIVPSLLDAGPATVAEAMFCGLPVIVSDGCGARTLVEDGISGFVTSSGNSIELSDKINWFISNQDRIEIMGKEATKRIVELAKSNQNDIVANHILNMIIELQKL